jgi:hypothetical protein
VENSTIEIVRDTPDDIQDRWVRIFIDDAPKEILRYGETLRRRVAPGKHRIRAHNTLSSDTIEIEVAAGETARIRCYNHFAKGSAVMLLTMGVAFIKVRLELVPDALKAES